MAGPLAGIPAQEIVKQKLPDAAQQAQKEGRSKFDQNLKSHEASQAKATAQVQDAQHVNASQHVNAVEKVKQAEQSTKVQKAELSRLDPNKDRTAIKDPVTQKAEAQKDTSMIKDLIGSIEKSGVAVDKIINGGLLGKHFTNQEMLSLQAGMYKYSQELDLTSKVVEKATSGLKDTLKTQV